MTKLCAFSGHRFQSLPFGTDESSPLCHSLRVALTEQIEVLMEEGVTVFTCGMALGADQIFAELILNEKLKFPAIELHCYIPCEAQYARWAPAQKARYLNILRNADKILCLQKEYTRDCMIRRNHRMVDDADCLLAVWNGKRGGTSATVEYARRNGIPVICINPLRLENNE